MVSKHCTVDSNFIIGRGGPCRHVHYMIINWGKPE